MKLVLGVFLISHFFSELAINIVAIFDAFILVCLKLLGSVFKLLGHEFIGLYLVVEDHPLKPKSFHLFFLANDFSFQVRSFIDEAFKVCMVLLNFILEVSDYNRNLASKVTKIISAFNSSSIQLVVRLLLLFNCVSHCRVLALFNVQLLLE